MIVIVCASGLVPALVENDIAVVLTFIVASGEGVATGDGVAVGDLIVMVTGIVSDLPPLALTWMLAGMAFFT